MATIGNNNNPIMIEALADNQTNKIASPSSSSSSASKHWAIACGLAAVGIGLGLGLGLGLRNREKCVLENTTRLGSDKSIPSSSITGINLHQYEWIDLSYVYDTNTAYWPTSPSTFELEEIYEGDTDGGFYYSANSFCTPEHGGTHIDAPIHFARDKHTTDKIPLDTLNGPGIVIDISKQAEQDPDYRLTKQDIVQFEEDNDITIPQNSIVMLRTGYGKYYETNREMYLGDDPTTGDASNLHFPSYGEDAIRFLIAERHISVVGIDTASIDHGPSDDFIVHQLAFDANVPGLENVANLHLLPSIGSWIIALPMKIAGGTGGPTRIVALV